jgi:histidine triad (HIT) family protein
MPIEIPQQERCPFCRFAAREGESAIVEDLEDTFAFINPRMAGKGHMLVIPKRHAPTVLDLMPDEAQRLMHHIHRLARALSGAFDPCGLNIYQNNGISAGQSVPHYHVHIVPTYPGDEPGRIFKSQEIERSPIEERLEIAAQIAAHLPPRDELSTAK